MSITLRITIVNTHCIRDLLVAINVLFIIHVSISVLLVVARLKRLRLAPNRNDLWRADEYITSCIHCQWLLH
jgi:hypothetical protein